MERSCGDTSLLPSDMRKGVHSVVERSHDDANTILYVVYVLLRANLVLTASIVMRNREKRDLRWRKSNPK